VYFSESLIIFTSNLGIYDTNPVTDEKRVLVDDKMNYQEIESKIKKEIENFFKFTLSPPRPEILNRIGENIIVFDFIRPEICDKIYDKMMQSVLDTIKDNHQISLSIDPSVIDIMKQAICKDLSMGGRGIGNHIEEIFINPLSRSLFRENITDGDQVQVTGIHNEGSEWELILSKVHQNK
jgi:ATP-dependent Clp protease ATP-binding subunit ClpA